MFVRVLLFAPCVQDRQPMTLQCLDNFCALLLLIQVLSSRVYARTCHLAIWMKDQVEVSHEHYGGTIRQ